MRESKTSLYPDDRVWYDQFTSTDWVHDSIADAYRVKALRSRTDLRGRIKCFFDGAQGWILSAVVGFLTAVIAYVVDVSEAPVFDWKDGYCSTGFLISEKVSLGYKFCFIVPRIWAQNNSKSIPLLKITSNFFCCYVPTGCNQIDGINGTFFSGLQHDVQNK